MEMMINYKINLNDIKIRKVNFNDKDISKIIDITQECFPYSLKWNSLKYFLKIRWQYILASQYNEVYILLFNNRVAGFYILVTDMLLNKKEKKEKKLQYLFLKISSILTMIIRPYLIITTIKKIYKIFFIKNFNLVICDNIITQEKIAWAELQGIGIKYRGKGLSKIMHEFIVRRCLELGKEAICSLIDPNNTIVVHSRKSLNFIKMKESKYGHTYIKYLIYPKE